MEAHELLKIYDQEQRIDVIQPNTHRDVNGRVIRHITPSENFGFISHSRLDEASVDAEIEAQIAFFNDLGMGFEWKVYDHDQPADLRERLSARGFDIEDREALMVLDLDAAPDFIWSIPLPVIERVTDLDGLERIRQLEEEVWGDDHAWMIPRMGADLRATPDQLSMFGVRADGKIVSAAWIYYHPPTRFGSLWGGSTLPDYRGRGYYTALLAVRAREARQRGYRFLTVDASPMSRPILEKHGFQFLGYSTPCVWNSKPSA